MTSVAFRPSAHRPSTAGRRVPLVGPRAVPARSTRLYVRRRIGVGLAAIVLAVVGVGVSSTRFADAGQTRPTVDAPADAPVVIVQPGDTLWSLAREVQPDGDIRPLVAQLSRSHGGSSLRAGERIVLPVR